MAHLRELSLETLAPVGWGFCLPFTYPASVPMVFLVGDRGPKASVWPDCGVGIGRPEHARQARNTVELMRSWRRFLTSFLKNSKAAIAKWKDAMKDCGLAARWVKSRSIVGVDLQHNVNWAEENHFEQCLASGPLVPRAILELMSWTGICLVCNCRELWMRLFTL